MLTAPNSFSRLRALAALACFSVLPLACGSEDGSTDDGSGATGACQEGQAIACYCSDGVTQSTQLCQGGMLQPCQCGGGTVAAAGGAAGTTTTATGGTTTAAGGTSPVDQLVTGECASDETCSCQGSVAVCMGGLGTTAGGSCTTSTDCGSGAGMVCTNGQCLTVCTPDQECGGSSCGNGLECTAMPIGGISLCTPPGQAMPPTCTDASSDCGALGVPGGTCTNYQTFWLCALPCQ